MAFEWVLGIIIGVILLVLGYRFDGNSVPAGGIVKLGMILFGLGLLIWGISVGFAENIA